MSGVAIAETPLPAARSLPNWFFNLLLPLGFGLLTLLVMPIATVFQFDVDEGQELIKAILYNQGYALFTEISADHPPLLTVFLAPWLRLWGNSVFASRLLILGFSTVLVWAFAQILRRAVGDRYALMGACLLVLTANFLRLSVSVMIGMPALTCLLFSLYALVKHQESQRGVWLVIAGIAAGMSLQFKMFTILLLPLWGVYLWVSERPSNQPFRLSAQRPWLKLCLWSIILLTTFWGLGLLLGIVSLKDVFLFHLNNDVKNAFVQEHSLRDVAVFYVQELDYGLLMLWSLVPLGQTMRIVLTHLSQKIRRCLSSRPITKNRENSHFKPLTKRGRWDFAFKRNRKDYFNLIPLLWLVWVTVFLTQHKPIWYHHHLLIALPLTWLATLGLKTCVERIRDRQLRQQGWRGIRPALLTVAFALLVAPVKLTVLHLHNQSLLQETQAHQQVVAQIQAEASEGSWLFTDIPMYGVYTQRLLPPEIATLPRKRIAAGDFSAQLLAELIADYDLQQFVIGRFPKVEGFLNEVLPGQLQRTELAAATYYHRTATNIGDAKSAKSKPH